MTKFIVVCFRRPDWPREQFRRYFQETHGPLAMAIPGVRRYVHLDGRGALLVADDVGNTVWRVSTANVRQAGR